MDTLFEFFALVGVALAFAAISASVSYTVILVRGIGIRFK